VYQVRSAGGWEYDVDSDVSQAEEDDSYNGEVSGGVYHLTKEVPVVARFANRIRHVALGGIVDAMDDDMHMHDLQRAIFDCQHPGRKSFGLFFALFRKN
jgi:hypothetical protein